MATEQVKLNPNQAGALKEIVASGKTEASEFDKRTINALESRGLVKVSENKKGTFVAPTAKGKKVLN